MNYRELPQSEWANNDGFVERVERLLPPWENPKPLPDGLLPVDTLDPRWLPDRLRKWIEDISDRMQCPLDYPAATAYAAAGSLIGRRCGIRPKRRDDWLELPNLWACLVGRPGTKKTPALNQVLMPLNVLEAEAREEQHTARASYERSLEASRLMKDQARNSAKEKAKQGAGLEKISEALDIAMPAEPKAKRYVTSDCSYEALGVLLRDNPNGMLAVRDEVLTLLNNLSREDNHSARGFFLSGGMASLLTASTELHAKQSA